MPSCVTTVGAVDSGSAPYRKIGALVAACSCWSAASSVARGITTRLVVGSAAAVPTVVAVASTSVEPRPRSRRMAVAPGSAETIRVGELVTLTVWPAASMARVGYGSTVPVGSPFTPQPASTRAIRAMATRRARRGTCPMVLGAGQDSGSPKWQGGMVRTAPQLPSVSPRALCETGAKPGDSVRNVPWMPVMNPREDGCCV